MNETPTGLGPSSNTGAGGDWQKREIRLAIANAVKLGSSMVITWGIALVGRLYVPRFLGPDRFGTLNFADAFCGTVFVALGLGLDTYVRREISVRPQHATDFVGGVLALRLILLALIFLAVEPILRSTHRTAEVRQLVYIYGAAQFFMADSSTTAGLLQAVGKVNTQSVLSVLIKLAWAGCIFVAIAFRLGLWAFAMTITLTEAIKAAALFWMAKKQLGFELRIHLKPTWLVLVASLPFFVSNLATTIYGRIGVSILAFMTNDREVGWFGAASGLHGMSLMLVPIVAWVLTPLFARSAAASVDELYDVVRPSFALTMALATPLALMMIVGADYWVSIAFGAAFAPAALGLRVLAVATPLMYMSIVAAYALAVLKLTWRMTMVFLGGILVSPTCNLLLIRPMAKHFGPGGAGGACAAAALFTEVAIAIPLVAMLGRRCFDRELTSKIVKSTLAAAGVVALDAFLLRPWGPVRLVADAVLYVVAVTLSGALDLKGTLSWLKDIRKRDVQA